MKERLNCSGRTPRDEMLRDAQMVMCEEQEHDLSYLPTVYFYDPVTNTDYEQARLRLYNEKYSTSKDYYIEFVATYDNPIKEGDYLHNAKDDTYWLVFNVFDVGGAYFKGEIRKCSYLLYWQLADGTIVNRWANIVSASKYDEGENSNNTIILSTNNYTVLIG